MVSLVTDNAWLPILENLFSSLYPVSYDVSPGLYMGGCTSFLVGKFTRLEDGTEDQLSMALDK